MRFPSRVSAFGRTHCSLTRLGDSIAAGAGDANLYVWNIHDAMSKKRRRSLDQEACKKHNAKGRVEKDWRVGACQRLTKTTCAVTSTQNRPAFPTSGSGSGSGHPPPASLEGWKVGDLESFF